MILRQGILGAWLFKYKEALFNCLALLFRDYLGKPLSCRHRMQTCTLRIVIIHNPNTTSVPLFILCRRTRDQWFEIFGTEMEGLHASQSQ
uniref:Uncharacterized protein n=1 Tax=Utricularia reniformis TaxID=192314 RepID=A0A1Y0AYY5_9LAMI|nr:hypothetical protein AEK19_MT1396 [Utricularia reniformis]ART30376.1 hypothetical protein AEK19_MT1396 [Utricularia reniformis]